MNAFHILVARYLDRLLEAVSGQWPVGFLEHLCISYHSPVTAPGSGEGGEGVHALTFSWIVQTYKNCEIPF